MDVEAGGVLGNGFEGGAKIWRGRSRCRRCGARRPEMHIGGGGGVRKREF